MVLSFTAEHLVHDLLRPSRMGFINDAVKSVGRLQLAMAKVELHHVSWKVVCLILSTGLAEGVNRERAVKS